MPQRLSGGGVRGEGNKGLKSRFWFTALSENAFGFSLECRHLEPFCGLWGKKKNKLKMTQTQLCHGDCRTLQSMTNKPIFLSVGFGNW